MLQFYGIIWYQTSCEVLHKLDKITLQIRRVILSTIRVLNLGTYHINGSIKDLILNRLVFKKKKLRDLNVTHKCNSIPRSWLTFWFVDSLPPWFYRGNSPSLRTPTPQTGWSDFVRSNAWRPRSSVARINKTSATSWSRCLSKVYKHESHCHH